jgi:hypothetical protein
MKKTIQISILIMTAAFFCACKKSSTPTPNPVIGTWQATTAHIVTTDSSTIPATVTSLDTTYTTGKSIVFVFANDSTVYLADYTVTPSTITAVDKYQINSASITFIDQIDSTQYSAPYTISGNTMSLTIPLSFPGESISSTYQLTKQ